MDRRPGISNSVPLISSCSCRSLEWILATQDISLAYRYSATSLRHDTCSAGAPICRSSPLWGIRSVVRLAPTQTCRARGGRDLVGTKSLGHIERADCVQGKPPGAVTSTLFVCNHISWLDILALLAVRPMRFVAKSEVRSWPMIGWMAMKTGTVFLRRNECRHLPQVKRTIEAALAHGGCIAIFPEATTTDGITVRPFHSGLFESAVVSGATVWPVALRTITRMDRSARRRHSSEIKA